MWVECESGELLNLSRADRVRINRDYLVADVMEPEEWSLLGTICSLKGVSDENRKGMLGILFNALGDSRIFSYRWLFVDYPR